MENNHVVLDFLTKGINSLNLVVIGDIMLDCYYYGSVTRISPEAPVPVNKVLRDDANLGGAGNVAANLALLGAKVFMCSLIGQDENGKRLNALLDGLHIDKSGVFACERRKTTTKMRVIGSNQQMLRLDFEEIEELSDEEESQVLDWFAGLSVKGVDGVIISDYAKGICSDSFCRKVIERANSFKIPVLVDPKGYDWAKYRGADFITPNVKELGEAAQRPVDNTTEAVRMAAEEVLARYGVKSALVTRSEKGMTFISAKDSFTVSSAAREVYDVSGAGDTAAAAFLCAVAGGLENRAAAFIANQAAGVVVGRAGTYAIRREELLEGLLERERNFSAERLVTREEGQKLVESWRKLGEKIVFTNGCFDILHTGHIAYLEKAARLGNRLVIGLNSDESVARLKGSTRPLVGEKDRARLLSALACVDAVILFSEDTPEELLQSLRPDIITKGGDYRPEQVAGREYAQEVKIIDFEEGYSTTGIVNKIAGLVKEGKL